MSSWEISVHGTIHPPPAKPDGMRGWMFEQDEMGDLQRGFCGRRVCVEHDPAKQIGRVVSIGLDSMGNITAHLAIDMRSQLAKATMLDVSTGAKLGLSVRFLTDRDPIHLGRRGPIYPLEISIVRNPQHPRSRILYYGDRPTMYVSRSGVNVIYHNMSTTGNSTDKHEGDEATRWDAYMDVSKLAKDSGLTPEAVAALINCHRIKSLRELNTAQANRGRFERLCQDLGAADLATGLIRSCLDEAETGFSHGIDLINIACAADIKHESGRTEFEKLKLEHDLQKAALMTANAKLAAIAHIDPLAQKEDRRNPAQPNVQVPSDELKAGLRSFRALLDSAGPEKKQRTLTPTEQDEEMRMATTGALDTKTTYRE